MAEGKEIIQEIEEPRNNKILYWIIGILGLLVIFLGYQVMKEKGENTMLVEETIPELELERNNLELDLQNMFDQYDTLTVANEDLSADLVYQKDEVARLMDKVSKLDKNSKAYRWEISKLKKEAGTLRDIMKGYLVTIDSLNTANAELTVENTKLNKDLTKVSGEKDNLATKVSDQEDIIKAGSILQAINLRAMAIRVKASGNQQETSRAKRAEMIKSTTTLGENRIAKAGKKTIFMRVISPEGSVLPNPDNPSATFEYNGVSGRYSAKRVIDYANVMKEIEVFYPVSDELSTGQYIVELYESGAKIGRSTFDLR